MKAINLFKNSELLAVLSGLLLTACFPNIGLSGLAWFAMAPLIVSLRDLQPKDCFRIGYLFGIVHYLSLMYWLVYTMRTYGYLPWYLSVAIFFLLTAYLALYMGIFSYAVCRFCHRPSTLLLGVPILWVSLEYFRSFLLSGLPWELIGYSQYRILHLIQVSDLFGVYGLSFLLASANAVAALILFSATGMTWKRVRVSKRLSGVAALFFISIFSSVWFYGESRLKTVDRQIAGSPLKRVAVIQGNIEQTIKWDPKFQEATTEKYIRLSQLAQNSTPALIVWPETATPFYFLYDAELSEKVIHGIRNVGTDFLIGSPSFIHRKNGTDYYNSAYLIRADGTVAGKYDKVHLVPFGEYIPFKRFLPFLGKIVAEVGDFKSGKKGLTISWGDSRLGLQICYEIIFPNLSREMTKNGAALLVNITNDAWFGRTGAPYQHFSMAVFRAVENRRALVRAANTGISGYIDPAGRVPASTRLFQEAKLTRSVPLLRMNTFYTRFGDLFAWACLVGTIVLGVFTGVVWSRK